ncbi:MAG: hypothetical protein R3251_02845 [Candidatus Spechtbacterales bacterium]|nr:hypothetical protein [Candidatus Spechtbacterales bacterium]
MTKKEDRNEQILLDIVEEYIKTAEPVSSGYLLKKHKYDISSATLRNIMASLDEAGFLYQPHTSAGRVPTRKAYQFFVDKVALGSREMPKKEKKSKARVSEQFKKELREAMKESPDMAAHMLSRHLAEMTNAMAFAGLLSINHFYKEGLRYLLDEPEFINTENIRSLVEYADSLERRIDKLYKAIQDDIRVYIGDFASRSEDTPFSLMAFTSELPGHERGIFGIIGPMRMQYNENLRLLDDIRDLFEEY